MNKLLKLIKIDIIHSYSINKLNKKHNAKRKLGSLIATLILGLFLLCFIAFIVISLGVICKQTNQLDTLLILGYTLGTVLCFTVTISKANGFLFEARDFELLMSMPISNKTIVFSKLCSLLILNYLGFGAVFIPCLIVYGVLSLASIGFYILGLIAFLIGPFLVVAVCSFISYLLGLLLRRTKFKSIIMSMVSLLIFIVFMVFYMSFVVKTSAIEGELGDDFNAIMQLYGDMIKGLKENIQTYYPIAKFLSEGLQGNLVSYLIYLVIMVIPFALLVLVVSKNFLKANMRSKNSSSSKNYTFKDQKQENKIVAIFKRDFKRFISSTNQMLNIGIGPILSTILVVVMAINFKNIAGSETNEEADFIINKLLPLLLVLTAGFTFGIMPSTSSSISLEGKSFWILKSSPIKTEDVLISKVLFYVIICLPFILVNTALIYFFTNVSVFNCILVLLIQISLVFGYSLEGLWINILTPKFDWDNEVKAIKQGTGTLLSMLFGFALGVILYVPPFIFIALDLNGFIILLVDSLVVSTIMGVVLFTHGKKRYEQLEV